MRKWIFLSRPHQYQRYDTVGDYQESHGVTFFTVSEMGNEDYEALVAVHELVEYLLCKKRGISMQAIDDFDKQYETDRDLGDESEPGWSPDAPYQKEHVFAEKVERMLAEELGIDWDVYDRTVVGLSQ